MGLFGSKKKTVVHTEVMRIIEDDQLPQSSKTGVIKAIMQDGDISAYLLEDLVASMAFKAERFYDYAEDHYPLGLPYSTLTTSLEGQDIVEQTIELLIGHTVTTDYFQFAGINSLHVAWQALVESYGYVADSNELTVLSASVGSPVYLDDMIAVYSQATIDEADPGELDQWGTSPRAGYTPQRPAQVGGALGEYRSFTPWQVDEDGTEDYVEVRYVWQTAPGAAARSATLQIPISGFDEDADYYQVRYRWKEVITPAVGMTPEVAVWHTGFWTYLDGAGTYPAVDNIRNTSYAELGRYFPFVYFRLDDENMGRTAVRNTDLYKTSKEMLRKLDMDFQATVDAIHENPDINDIEQAIMVFAVPANATSEVERSYLFDHFDLLYFNSAQPVDLVGATGAYDAYTSRAGQAIVFQDQAFKFTLSYRGIGKRRIAGSIGAVGSHSSGTGSKYVTSSYIKRKSDGSTVVVPTTVNTDHHWYRRQINALYYDEIVVYDPRLRYHIYGKHTYTGKTGDDCLLIPIDRALIDTVQLIDREELYARSMHYVFNTRITIKVKWYQSGWFKAVVIVVAIVVTVVSMGGASAIWTALASMTASALAAAILTRLVMSIVIQYGLKLFTEAVGGDVALVVGAIAAVVAAAVYFGSDMPNSATWAQNLLQASNGLTRASAQAYQEDLTGLQDDMMDFQDYALEQQDLLDETRKLLDTGITIDPLEMVNLQPMTLLNETPANFYLRTVHAGNIGSLGIAAMSEYYDLQLQLPSINDTLGEHFNGIV